MNDWLLVTLVIFVQVYGDMAFRKRVGRGIISKRMARWPWFKRARSPGRLRTRQFWSSWTPMVVASYVVNDHYDDVAFVAFCLWIVVLYLDDYLFGDDDNFRRFWEGVRNKVRWKMELPQPIRERGSGTG